ncbi:MULTISPECIES: undecaprenyl-diphosphate phosphatase [Weeksella]|uniref:Undecaprenyl-diphosphatase n=1 Tax=Weeksella virosa (strain ATCC 43766 / DSM 16922 / JCM 21250 / CCUG 30538 / CDC 9751 / IAM 14551 / NBRC 16016 / NCTC 11634 / CL345/78) TaxID=865938 RepID=F0NZ77_WEEVC|nr:MULTISPECIES: undecaprenyl-diphosphate phosphatase [Weeksella]ADX67206.1 Undecaprenyl-diphosphatase [Weeksella virosa DSM 16922]MDK7375016.1 undecaprenyl-diphosphate phosphatase [Weeksella virosa]MDK7675945.1 undecaprenyl-diphosphate phosphatase [Weeksella virosa]OFM81694.1 UDP-diphosphatase [Weeksella sp. HMSC059D05]SUP53476.1 Undecaprenyl-diphosphatase [Weeksella virosa]
MNTLEAIIIAIIEGLTEYLPISSTAHMGFTAALLGLEESEFLKMFQVSIQFGAILSIVVLYWKKFFDFSNFNFYLKLIIAVIPALFLGYLFDDKIEAVLGNQIAISTVLVIGGVILIFCDKWFKNPKILDEKEISYKKAFIIGFWQCLAMMPGTSRSAASIIGGMTQGLSRKAAAEFSFFLAVPTMLAVTVYSIFVKTWGKGTPNEMKGYEMILQDNHHIMLFALGNIIAFVVALIAVKTFIAFLTKYGFKVWGWYRIIIGVVLLIYFWNQPQKENVTEIPQADITFNPTKE